jgi:hypothetical protein
LHPIVQPTENHKQVCAEAHALLPLRHAHGAPLVLPRLGTHA